MGTPEENIRQNPNDYAYASGVVQALERKMLSGETLNQMAEASSLDAALKLLGDSEYSPYLTDGSAYEDFTGKEMARMRLLHAKLVPSDSLTGLPFIAGDFANIKYSIKSFLKRDEPRESDSSVGWTPWEKLQQLVYEQPKKTENSSQEEYVRWIRKAFSSYEQEQDPGLIDLVLDQGCFEYLHSLCQFRRAKFALGYLAAKADLQNYITLLRLVSRGQEQGIRVSRTTLNLTFLPHGTIPCKKLVGLAEVELADAVSAIQASRYAKALSESLDSFVQTGNWSSLERAVDEYLVRYLRRARWVACGYEPVLAYFLTKESEVRLLRVVLNGKSFGLPSAQVRERLWSTYV